MDFDTYETGTNSTAIYPQAGTCSEKAINYALVSLAGEAGSLLNKWKKYLRGDIPFEEIVPWLLGELGDVQYYLARAALEMGSSLDDVAKDNLKKLADRKERGVLQGSGSNR